MPFLKPDQPLLTPEQKLVLIRHHASPFTPDTGFLSEYQRQLLFVCDEWMSDRRMHFVLDELGGIKHRPAFTRGLFKYLIHEGFTWLKSDPRPVPIQDNTGWKIKGEIYSLPNPVESFTKLDKLKQNGLLFRRKRVYVLCTERDEIVFENTTEERGPMYSTRGIHWVTGKFSPPHPLAGKKRWVSKEKVHQVMVWMYIATPMWKDENQKHPEHFTQVPRFTPKVSKRWLSEYYKYQNPESG